MLNIFSSGFFAWNGHSFQSIACLFFGIMIGAFLMRNVTIMREIHLSAIPILLCVGSVFLMTHSGHGAVSGLVFDKGYALQYILYGTLFGMISFMLFRLFRIAARECDFSTPTACFAFLIFPFYLPLIFIFARDSMKKKDKPNGSHFSVSRSCFCVIGLFGAVYSLSPHYSPKVFAEIKAHGSDVRGLVLAHREDRKQ